MEVLKEIVILKYSNGKKSAHSQSQHLYFEKCTGLILERLMEILQRKDAFKGEIEVYST